jgi:ATPase subunit of ABC transporter with duplicated ATPase domains
MVASGDFLAIVNDLIRREPNGSRIRCGATIGGFFSSTRLRVDFRCAAHAPYSASSHDDRHAAGTCPSPPLDAPGQERILDVEDLSVAFDGATILTNINFGVPRGASLAIIGPNGAGKTVLFKALLGSVPSTGHIRWAPATRLGYVPPKLDLARRRADHRPG